MAKDIVFTLEQVEKYLLCISNVENLEIQSDGLMILNLQLYKWRDGSVHTNKEKIKHYR